MEIAPWLVPRGVGGPAEGQSGSVGAPRVQCRFILVPQGGGCPSSPAARVVQVPFLLALLVHSSHAVCFTAKELHTGLPGS